MEKEVIRLQRSSRTDPPLFEEWGYAERAWYLEGQTGIIGVIRALLWPTEGIVEVGLHDRVWADRASQPPTEIFTFFIGDEGYRRMRRHLRATIRIDQPVETLEGRTFFPAVHSYHLFHTCHQYAARALREAGLPLSPALTFNRTSLAWQLRRALTFAGESGAVSSAITDH